MNDIKNLLNLRKKDQNGTIVVEKIILKPRGFIGESLRILVVIAIVSISVWGISQAGSLTPLAGVPAKTMYTLDNIYTLVTTGTTTASTNFVTPGTATSTFHTLADIVRDYHTPSTTHNPNTAGPFVADGQADQGYLDQNTGLTWQHTDAGQYLCWDKNQDCGPIQALEYCNYLDANGVDVDGSPQNIWRLPTVKEWSAVFDYSTSTFSTYNLATTLPNSQSGYYWSSTEYAPYTGFAWVVGTGDGYVNFGYKGSGNLVRCVR
jgi:hypothetical protein